MIAAEHLDSARAFLIDLDGTLIRGNAALPGARLLLDRLRDRFAIVSNDAEHTPQQLTRALGRLGLTVPEERIVLAGTAALDLIASERPHARVLLLGSPSLQRYADRLHLHVVEQRPDLVVIARDRQFSFARLAAAVNAVRAGAELVATNPDRTHPGPSRTVVPETGALLAAVLSCTGPVPHRVIGKPEPTLFLTALERLGVRSENAAVIGDNPETDGVGALRLGMRYLHVDAARVAARESEAPQGQAGGLPAALPAGGD